MKTRQSIVLNPLSVITLGMVIIACNTGHNMPPAMLTPTMLPATSDPAPIASTRILATSTPNPTSASVPKPLPIPADPEGRALWVWNAEVATNDEARATFLDFVQSEHISTVYFHAYGLLSINPTALEAFIAQAGDTEVELLAGDPSWTLAANHSIVLDFVQDAIAFTKGAADAGQPTGLHFDVEPYLLDEWKSDQPGTIAQYLDLLVAIRDELARAGSDLRLCVDVPFWYDTIEAAFNGELKPLHQHVLDTVDCVTIMDYRDTAEGSDGITAHAQDELSYANQNGRLVTVGVETNCIEPPKITFCEEGKAALEEELARAKQVLKANPSFHGFAIHDYAGYARLLQSMPTPTPESPTLTPAVCPHASAGSHSPHTIIQIVSYSLNGGPAQAVSSEGELIVHPGDTISLVELWYCSDSSGSSGDVVQGEAYLRKNGDYDYGDGRFTDGVPIQANEHPIGSFDGGWTIQPGWNRLVIALIHYYQGGHEVDDRFFINLDVQ